MPVILTKDFSFEAAHFLPKFPEGHKCRRLHGHSFRVEIRVEGKINPETGILIDFSEIKEITKPLIEMLDHRHLNEIGEKEGIELLQNPTSENIAKWLYHEIKAKLPELKNIWVSETCTTSCEYFED